MDKGLSVLAHTGPDMWQAIEAEYRRRQHHAEPLTAEGHLRRTGRAPLYFKSTAA